ncbi:MAG: hypothetical protein JXC85_04195 [Candidatus Aenigmarchaeota archaeon]|nr:hypothetical protein [Candidatus Aenigmarchaeota archaeon]
MGSPRRYLCSAKYTEGSDTRYLIREVVSPKTGNDLRDAVIELFVSDLEGKKDKAWMDREASGNMKEMNRVYLTGKLTDLSIDELEQSRLPYRKSELVFER